MDNRRKTAPQPARCVLLGHIQFLFCPIIFISAALGEDSYIVRSKYLGASWPWQFMVCRDTSCDPSDANYNPPVAGCRAISLMPNMTGMDSSVAACAEAAFENGFPGFALQNGSQCLGSAQMLSTYTEYGLSSKCSNGWNICYSYDFFCVLIYLNPRVAQGWAVFGLTTYTNSLVKSRNGNLATATPHAHCWPSVSASRHIFLTSRLLSAPAIPFPSCSPLSQLINRNSTPLSYFSLYPILLSPCSLVKAVYYFFLSSSTLLSLPGSASKYKHLADWEHRIKFSPH